MKEKVLAADRAGNVYIADGNARVQKFTSTGSYIGQWALAMVPGNASSSLAVDSFGDIYAANTGPTSNIQKFRNDGALLAQ